MADNRKVIVTKESDTGRNERFKDIGTGRYMDTSSFVKAIERGTYSNYHVRNVNGIKTPVANPDKSKNNNLDK